MTCAAHPSTAADGLKLKKRSRGRPAIDAAFAGAWHVRFISLEQNLAIALATLGVALLLLRLEHAPWIAFGLAGTWSFYGVLKKQSALGSLQGLTVETLLLFPFAAAWLLWLAARDGGVFGHATASLHALAIGSGLVTAVPLLMFAWGAQRLRFTTIGLLQYLGPTLQFLIGLLVYHEPLGAPQLRAFAFIWAGLLLYTADGFLATRGHKSR